MVSYSDVMPPGAPTVRPVDSKVILAVLSLAALTYAVLSSAVIPALPTIQRSLDASETGVTWLLTGFLLSASVGTAIIGKLGDMYGKQRLLVWTLLVLAAGTLLACSAARRARVEASLAPRPGPADPAPTPGPGPATAPANARSWRPATGSPRSAFRPAFSA